jgi:hypothetical protein
MHPEAIYVPDESDGRPGEEVATSGSIRYVRGDLFDSMRRELEQARADELHAMRYLQEVRQASGYVEADYASLVDHLRQQKSALDSMQCPNRSEKVDHPSFAKGVLFALMRIPSRSGEFEDIIRQFGGVEDLLEVADTDEAAVLIEAIRELES